MSVEQESLVVVRDKEGRIAAVVSKKGAMVEIYQASMTSYEDVLTILQDIANSK